LQFANGRSQIYILKEAILEGAKPTLCKLIDELKPQNEILMAEIAEVLAGV